MQSRRRTGLVTASLVLVASLLRPADAHAQAGVLPGSERPELPPFQEQEPGPLELPPPPPPEEKGLAAGLRVYVRAFRIEGSTVFPEQELAKLVEPWTNRFIASEQLVQVREAITDHYIEHGYITSGATIPDQSLSGGEVTVRIVEGDLASIEVEGTRRFRPGYFRTRLRRAGRAPVNVERLEAQLQRFQRDPRIRRVRARLLPGERAGESVLRLDVEENRFYGLALGFSNENSPSVGAYTGTISPVVSNLAGWGDEWRAEVQLTDGLVEVDASVAVPLPPFDTLLEGHFQYSNSNVVENPFDVLDIEADSTTWGTTLSQPLLSSELQQLQIGLTGDYRTSDARLLGECFAFLADTDDCKSKLTVLRTFADWVLATRHDVVAARSTFSVGVDWFGATHRSDGPDSRFLTWLGQLQWAHRLPERLLGSELVFRVDTQLADDPLLGIEKFAVGGLRTVRGYRESQYVRDNGVVASGELRVPVWRVRERPVLELAPFVDYGRSWNTNETSSAETLWSVGVGLRVAPWEWLRGEIYWGHAFEDPPDPGGDLQDDGILFLVTLVAL